MPAYRDDYLKAKEALTSVSQALDAALVAMNRLSQFKTHDDAAQITLMNQRLAHVRRFREDFNGYFTKVEEAAAALEKARE